MLPHVFSTDSIIIAALIGGGLYGMWGGRVRIRNLILSIYVGIVLAQTLAAVLAPYTGSLTVDARTIILFTLPVILFNLFQPHHSPSHGGGVFNLLGGMLAAALLVAAVLHSIAPSTASTINNGSYLSLQFSALYLVLVGIVPLIVLIPQPQHKAEKH